MNRYSLSRYLTGGLIMLTFLISCSKTSHPQTACIVTGMQFNGNDSIIFEYDNERHVKQIKWLDKNHAVSRSRVCTYRNNLLDTTIDYTAQQRTAMRTYEYNNMGLISKINLFADIAVQQANAADWTNYNTHDPGVTQLELLAYALSDLQYRRNITLDSFNASVQIIFYPPGNAQGYAYGSTKYSFDNAPNPFYKAYWLWPELKEQVLFKNSIAKATYKDIQGQILATSFTATIQAGSNQQPSMAERVYADGKKETQQWRYDCR